MSARTKKSGQRKAFAVGIAAFASVCLIATGFAAWVISAKAEEKKTGNVNIGTVSNADVKINVEQDTNNDHILESANLISFNPVKDDKLGRVRWDGTNSENLSITLTGTVSPQRFVTSFTLQLDLATLDTDGETWVVDTAANRRFNTAAGSTKNYITLPDCFANPIDLKAKDAVTKDTYSYTESTSEDNNAAANFSYTINFGWGTAFNSKNPSIFYDSKEVGDGGNIDDKARKDTLNDFYTTMTEKTVSEDQTAQVEDDKLHFLVTLTAGTDQK